MSEPKAIIRWQSPISTHWFILRHVGGTNYVVRRAPTRTAATRIPFKHALLFVEGNDTIQANGLSGSFLVEVVDD